MPPARALNIVSLGDLVTDIILSIPRLPVEADTNQVVDHIQMEPGGAGNFLIAGARLGMQMTALGAVGTDTFGAGMLDILSAQGVDTRFVINQQEGTTTTVVVLVDLLGRHSFLGNYGTGLPVRMTEDWKRVISSADAIIAWGYALAEKRIADTVLEAMRFARSANRQIFFDPGPQMANIPAEIRKEVLALSTGLILTEDEIPSMTDGIAGLGAARMLLEKGLRLIVVKRGEEGCVVATRNRAVQVPAIPVQVRDTNGAGDVFNAAFLYAYLNGWGLQHVGIFANAVGAAKTRKIGSGRSVPTLQEVLTILAEFKLEVPFTPNPLQLPKPEAR
jgi:ribokinase